MENIILEKLSNIENLLRGQTEKPLTLEEAARYLDLSTSTLYKMTSSRQNLFFQAERQADLL